MLDINIKQLYDQSRGVYTNESVQIKLIHHAIMIVMDNIHLLCVSTTTWLTQTDGRKYLSIQYVPVWTSYLLTLVKHSLS